MPSPVVCWDQSKRELVFWMWHYRLPSQIPARQSVSFSDIPISRLHLKFTPDHCEVRFSIADHFILCGTILFNASCPTEQLCSLSPFYKKEMFLSGSRQTMGSDFSQHIDFPVFAPKFRFISFISHLNFVPRQLVFTSTSKISSWLIRFHEKCTYTFSQFAALMGAQLSTSSN